MPEMYRERILCVDDELISLRITKRILEAGGYEVETVQSAVEALRRLSVKTFDLVISDITMPSLSGFDLIQLMQSLSLKVPLIFFSESDNAWSVEEAYRIGARRFVSKDREFDSLVEIVREVLATVS